MAKQMVAEATPPNQRQMAALVIKNSVIATNELSTMWFSIPNQQRDMIKQLLIQGLSLSNGQARATASQVVGQIGARELSNGQWTDLIKLLVGNMASGSPVLQEGTLNALGVLCEEIPSGILQSQSADILNAIISGANIGQSVEIKRAAIKALLGAICFIGQHFELEVQRNFIMNVILEAVKSQDKETRLFALQCFVRTAEYHYNHIAPYFESIWNVTLTIIKSDIDPIAQQAIEFWSTLCDIETSLYLEIQEAEEANEPEDIVMHHVIRHIAKHLLPILFECLTKQSDNIFEDEWNTPKCASACITLMAQTIQDDIIPISMPFIANCIGHENWRYKEAATLALGCILEGPKDQARMEEVLEQALPYLVRHLKEDPNLVVKDTSAWTIGKIASTFSAIIEKHAFPVIESLIIGLNHPEQLIAVQACNTLLNVISLFSYEEEETSPLSAGFGELFNALLVASDRSGACENNLCVTAYEAMNALISGAAEDCRDIIIKIVPSFIQKLEHTFDASVDTEVQLQLQSYIPSILQTITSIIGELIAPYAEGMINLFIKIFQFQKTIVDEPMFAITSVLSEHENLIPLVFPTMKGFLIAAFNNPEDANSLIASLHCLSVMLDCSEIEFFSHDNGSFCDTIVHCFFQILQNPDAPFVAKPEIFSTFGDLSLTIGSKFERYFLSVMSSLQTASEILIQSDNDDKMIDNIIQLRLTIIKTYSMFVHSNFCALVNHLPALLKFLEIIWMDTNYRTKKLIKQTILLISDISFQTTFAATKQFMNSPLVQEIIKFCKNRSTSAEVRSTANKIQIS